MNDTAPSRWTASARSSDVGPARTDAINRVVEDAGIRFRASESIFARRANNRKVSTGTIVQ
jgi:hypothetical protein